MLCCRLRVSALPRSHLTVFASMSSDKTLVATPAPVAVTLSAPSAKHSVRYADKMVDKFLVTRPMQVNLGELGSFVLRPTASEDCGCWGDFDRMVERRCDSETIFVVDSSEDDFGSRANFGRGHVFSAFAAGCPTSYEVFVRRLANVAVNSLNEEMAHAVCLIGSIDSADLTEQCMGLHASQGQQPRAVLIDAVKEHHQRLTDVIGRVFLKGHSSAKGLYLVNGDHNHMLSAIAGVYIGTGVKPVVVYIDLHADSRPIEDGPHSGTWCSDAFANQWVEHAYVVGLNALANSGPTLQNLDNHGVSYREYTWDRLKAGDSSLDAAAREICGDIIRRRGPDVPVILSICGDSVLNLPSSAGTGTIGYSVEEVYKFIAHVSRECKVSCLTVAELKTSLEPSGAPLIGEFLTQCLHMYHQNSRRISDNKQS